MQVDPQRAPCVQAEDKQKLNVFSQDRKSNKPLKAFSIMASNKETQNLYTSLSLFYKLTSTIYMITTVVNATRKLRCASSDSVMDVKIGFNVLLNSVLYCTACETLPALTQDLLLIKGSENQVQTRQQTYANSSPSINSLFIVSNKSFPIWWVILWL